MSRRAVKLRLVGKSIGVALPQEMLDRLDLASGDQVLAIETERGILLTPCSAALAADLDSTYRAAERYQVALGELVK